VVGIDRSKMKLYDVDEKAQEELITESKENGVINPKGTGMSWDKFKDEKKRKGLDKITV